MTSLERDLEALFEAQVRSLDVGNPPTLGDVEAADRSSGVSVPRPAVMAGGDVVDVELGDRIVEPVVANRRHWWTTVTVAAAVSLVVSVLVVSFRDVGELQPAVTPPMTSDGTPALAANRSTSALALFEIKIPGRARTSPESSSKSRTPKAQMSARLSMALPLACSGAM